MRANGPGEPGAHSTDGIDDQRLRWYPRQWRARYGDELAALLDEEYGDRLPASARFGLVSGGLRQRARASGLGGDSVPAPERVRAGALLVLAAWIAFVVAGANFAKFSEHFDEALPHSMETHRLPDLAFLVLQTTAGVASVLVVTGALLALPAFVQFLRADGWPLLRRHLLRALGATALTVVITVPLLLWAHRLTSQQRNGGMHWYGALYLLWAVFIVLTLTLWTVVAIAAARRVHLSKRILTAESVLAVAVAARNGDHDRGHSGLVGCDGTGRARLLERPTSRRPSFALGLALDCHRCGDGARDSGGRDWGDPRGPRLAAHASWLIHSTTPS